MRSRVFRFAPSPNGYLHLGHAFSALTNADAAAAVGGRSLLRIEDIDTTRARDQFEVAIFADLAWLGIAWEEPVLRQSDRFDAYRDGLAELHRLGLVYPGFLSRGEIRAAIGLVEAETAQASTFDRYAKELKSGKLAWGFIHSAKFWEENFAKFDSEVR